ncbi:hypothetical protein GLAREA_09382 [Glarea lozoyensis ATCC 20868]|uniref:Uncharacterized protein n=1 Tax=Glarea lozoyensis (strain ATCC 20868 / MF5171) TaxID=1116229 RepID=S3CP70_GLAL2|nr:uncharacterized protein GLAREA_09382 [Glarea lozoyensis ATCC 20868]EPE28262.1 hypothetical protein GLAREA_09382 [Glarea lozoyensis ATCC 20868]
MVVEAIPLSLRPVEAWSSSEHRIVGSRIREPVLSSAKLLLIPASRLFRQSRDTRKPSREQQDGDAVG